MTYLLDFIEDKNKKISYASSFGLKDIPFELKDVYRINLSNIEFLSTREIQGKEIIKNLTGKNAEIVLDPVFLLPKESWLNMCDRKDSKDKFIFSYTNRKDQLDEVLNCININKNEFKIHKITRYIGIMDFIKPNIKVDYFITPNRFLSNIKNAEIVITASFHCLAFSILFRKNFIVILTGNKGKDERLLNLLRITGLENRVFNENISPNILNEYIDYTIVYKKLEPYINHSKEFLNKSLGIH